MAFLNIPFSYVVQPEDTKRFSHQTIDSPAELNARTRDVEKVLRQSGISYISPLDELIANAGKERQYYFLDVHFTPAGNETVAGYAAPRIAELIAKSRQREPGGRASEPAP